ncbi:CEI_1a_G0003080.mRNA.1.CDS.1 [Saccharomyces cerevisiae]|nr:EM14S01-3B_G0014990.mRNA.1.CDS.1 [Saccharomyces cerevisiae]CAI4268431.1 AMH_1a_G0003230.mRNA.1.CDS.1 [Saccharomyces cerevisiae]CAI4273517.1 CEI_1a_G0003080.mRNA.1.CDS.1 [Saccharomyces cerevisiae]CAI6496013.1 AMH_1a_G0003230.mRNA.1.CDS.1 [Saccharomyces cerevisiae]CAI7146908.1 CEI_1a_G0003080.mRNA.1.CDS.1 [Saccharomyces cerevisiae]
MRGLPSTARAQGAPSPWRAGTLGSIPRQSPYKQRRHGTEQSQQEHEDMAITPDKQKKEQQHQPQNGPLDYAHICKCIAMFFVVAGVVLMFFETGLDPEQKEQIKRLHQLDGIPHA